jgi:hypothetical protein
MFRPNAIHPRRAF